MKKLIAWLGILAVSFSFIACSHDTDDNGDNVDGKPPITDTEGGGDNNNPPDGPITDLPEQYAPAMKTAGHLYIHYYRADGEYTDYSLWVWNDISVAQWINTTTYDNSGAVFDIRLSAFGISNITDTASVNFIVTTTYVDDDGIRQWGEKDGGDNTVILGQTQKVDSSYHWYIKEDMTSYGGNSFEAIMGVSHTHTYSTAWSSDESYHWHKATCGHDLVADKEYHNISPTTGKCTVCGYAPPEPEPVYITFSAGVGTFASGQDKITVAPDSDGYVSVESMPRADGYAFLGWYSGATEFDPSQKYTSSQTFTAKYQSGASEAVYTALFDESSTVSVSIDMADSEWKKLSNENDETKPNYIFKCPIYRYADSVTIGIDNGSGMLYYYYEGVGVRLKGNTSRHAFYNSNGFYAAAHFKLSFQETFDDITDGYTQDELYDWGNNTAARKARKARLFGGMEKLDIKYNATLDETYIRELYAMKLFREYDVIAPNITLCSMSALEKDTTMRNLGVYRIIEPVDELFVLRHTDDTVAGDLWKCTWGSKVGADMTANNLDNIVGVNDELNGKLYTYDKKTNKKVKDGTGALDFSSIKNFINAINGSDPNFESLIDTDYFARFEAVNYILGNPDCIRNNANNYFIYFRKSDGKAILIPYDYDRCLGLTYGLDREDGMVNATPFTRSGATSELKNPLYTKLIVKGAPYGEGSTLMKYRSALLSVSNSSLLDITAFNALKESYKARYNASINNAVSSMQFDDNWGGNKSVSDYVTKKLQTLNNNIDNYRA